MTTTGIAPQPTQILSPTARVHLKPLSERAAVLNGAWWPRSRDLALELPALIAVLDQAWGQINRVTVNVHMWPLIPRKVATGSHTVRVGWFDVEQDPNSLCLISHSRVPYRWNLLVIPPETGAEQAGDLMATAGDIHNRQTASALLADTSQSPPGDPV